MAKTYRAGPIQRPPTHPGAIIASNLEALGMTAYALEPLIGVTRMTLGRIIKGEASVTPDMALRFAKFFDTSPEFWLNMQMACDLYEARQKIGKQLDKIKTVEKPPGEPFPDEEPVRSVRAPKAR